MEVGASGPSHAQQAPPGPVLSDAVAQRALFSLQASTPAAKHQLCHHQLTLSQLLVCLACPPG